MITDMVTDMVPAAMMVVMIAAARAYRLDADEHARILTEI
jgi:Na+/melibiose symporter-like transporter